MDPLDDLLESMEEAPPKGDDAEMRAVLQRTAAGLTDAWEDKAALKARLRDLTQLLHIFSRLERRSASMPTTTTSSTASSSNSWNDSTCSLRRSTL